jgi:hypothetical protein
MASAGLWLMPFLQRKKIAPAGQRRAMIPASRPAPDGRLSRVGPQAAIASRTAMVTSGESGVAAFLW